MAESTINVESSLSAQELIEIVDENNHVLTPTTRVEMRKHRLIHRATYAFVRSSKNKQYFFVQKRSTLKDYCPGYYDPCPGGVVAAGESYAETNEREIEEEMGIKGAPITHLFEFYYEDSRVRCFGDAFEVMFDGDIGDLKLQVEEVESVHLMTMQEILQKADDGEKFTPDSIFACREYVNRYGLP